MSKLRDFEVDIKGKDGGYYKAVLSGCIITEKNIMARLGGDVKETIECNKISVIKVR